MKDLRWQRVRHVSFYLSFHSEVQEPLVLEGCKSSPCLLEDLELRELGLCVDPPVVVILLPVVLF